MHGLKVFLSGCGWFVAAGACLYAFLWAAANAGGASSLLAQTCWIMLALPAGLGTMAAGFGWLGCWIDAMEEWL